MNPNYAILIAGPTASGKSEVALAVAMSVGGEIINTDSMQVYEGLDILTAKPSPEDQTIVPHHLYGAIKANVPFSVASWLSLATEAAEQVWAKGKISIFVGGTGLYFKVLLEGLAETPNVPDGVRGALRQRLENEGVEALFQTLTENDPATAARLNATDKQRILRALEVFEATGKPLSAWQNSPQKGFLADARVLKVSLEVDREELEKRIRERFQTMVAGGGLDEVKGLKDLNLSPGTPIMKAIGVRPLQKHLAGEITLGEAIDLAVIESRQYAKRQRTWFRNQFSDWTFIPAGDGAASAILSLAKNYIKD